MRLVFIRHSHDRRWRRDDHLSTAFANPINVTMAVHDDRTARERANASKKPISVDQSSTDALGKCLGSLWVLDDVVVQRKYPARTRILRHDDLDSSNLFGRHEPERVREGKMGVRTGVQ